MTASGTVFIIPGHHRPPAFVVQLLGVNPRSVLSFIHWPRFCRHSFSVFPMTNGSWGTLGSKSLRNATHLSGSTCITSMSISTPLRLLFYVRGLGLGELPWCF